MNITHKYKLSVSIKTLNYSKIIGQNANYMITTQKKEQTNKQTTQTETNYATSKCVYMQFYFKAMKFDEVCYCVCENVENNEIYK